MLDPDTNQSGYPDDLAVVNLIRAAAKCPQATERL
jgi:hypothetical protein